MWPSYQDEHEFNAHLVCRMCCMDERDRVQKKTFTKWVNKHLMKVRKHISDLYEDLRDGHNLISLLEVLSGIKLPREKGRMRFHRLQNVQIALDFLKQRQVRPLHVFTILAGSVGIGALFRDLFMLLAIVSPQ
uniref:Calponin-homology (CH) domain-containing protein n=1 Tax=Castor canadensis TaxID=51338 RepID=A0A8C0XVV6_CASCN